MHDGKLRIAIFSDSYLPILNGVSISIDMLVNELRSRGHIVHIYTSGRKGHKDSDPNIYRFLASETPWTKGYPIALPPFFPMLHRFRSHTYDLIHTHTMFTVGFVGFRWGQTHDLPIVSTYHTLYDRYAHYIPFFPRRYLRFKCAKHTNYYYNRVDEVITPSEASLKWLRRHSVTTPVTVIPTGIPGRRLMDRSEIRAELGIQPNQRVMLYVGRIAQEKNLVGLFQMAQIAFRQDPSLSLWLVGDGPFRKEAAQMLREFEIGDRVRFVGALPRAEVDKYYASADLFVFCSITETQGLVVQEAMTYGLPAIVAQGGGAGANVIDGMNGYVVPNNPEIMANHAVRVLNDDKLYAQLSEGALRSTRDSGAGAMCDGVLDVYRRAIGAHSELTTLVRTI